MIPGLICDQRLFSQQINALEDRLDIHVVNHARDLTLSALAEEILDRVQGNFYLLGLSMGGYISFEILRQARKRGEQGRVEKLVLMATSPHVDPPDIEKRRRDFMALAARGKFKGMSPMLMRTFIHPSKMEDKKVSQTIYDMVESTGADGFIYQTKMVLGRPESVSDLPEVSCPTLIICGEDDERTPIHLSEEMAKLIPNSHLVRIENCGHLPPLEKPERVSDLLKEFLL